MTTSQIRRCGSRVAHAHLVCSLAIVRLHILEMCIPQVYSSSQEKHSYTCACMHGFINSKSIHMCIHACRHACRHILIHKTKQRFQPNPKEMEVKLRRRVEAPTWGSFMESTMPDHLRIRFAKRTRQHKLRRT